MTQHQMRIDATMHQAIVLCSCGWRGASSTRKSAWALAHNHTQAVDAPPPPQARPSRKKPR